MTPLLALLASLALSGAPTPERAIADAVSTAGARAEVMAVRGATPPGCAAARWDVPKPIEASGPVALRFSGRDGSGAACEGWAWADVRVYATALRLAHEVRDGERLEGAVEPAVAEVVRGRRMLTSLPPGATAARALRPGTFLAEADLRTGPRPGDPVTVLVRSGAVELSLAARAVPCTRDRACALLPSGRRVEGRWAGDRIEVETP